MTSIDYNLIAADASAIIAEFGATITLRQRAPGETFDPVLGTITQAAPAIDRQVKAVMMTPDENYAQLTGGTLVQAGDFLLLTLEGPPTLEGRYIVEGLSYEIVNIVKIAPALVPVLYIVQVRP